MPGDVVTVAVTAAAGTLGLTALAAVTLAWRLIVLPSPRARLVALTRRAPARRRGKPALLAGGACGAAVLVARLGQTTTAITAVIVVASGAWWWARRRRHRRADSQERARVAFFDALSGYLEAGASPDSAIALAASNAKPVHEEAARALALELTQQPGAESDPVARLWATAQTRGLPTARLVEQVRLRIEHQLRHRERITSALGGARSTAVVLSLLPLAGIALGSGMGADPIGILFGGGTGGWLLVGGVTLIAVGLGWSTAIIDRAGRRC